MNRYLNLLELLLKQWSLKIHSFSKNYTKGLVHIGLVLEGFVLDQYQRDVVPSIKFCTEQADGETHSSNESYHTLLFPCISGIGFISSIKDESILTVLIADGEENIAYLFYSNVSQIPVV